ncbi:MAG: EAL domain-containing protein [Halofilum sp. (in: g-proteobacteria)]
MITAPPRPLLVTSLLLFLPLVAVACSTYLLYQSALDEERARLLDLVRSQAVLIETITGDANASTQERYDRIIPVVESDLDLVQAALARFNGLGEAGEFVIGRREGDRVMLAAGRHMASTEPVAVSIGSERAQAMQRALGSEAGTLIGPDYDGLRVLAAFAPLQGLDRGLVAKIPMPEIRAPFVRTGLVSAGLGLVLGLVGGAVYLKQTTPLWRRLRRREREYAILLANLPGMVFRCRNDADWTMEFVSSGAREMAGFEPGDLRFSTKYAFATLIHEGDQQRVWETVQAAIAEDRGYEVRYRLYDVHGAVRHVWERGRPVHDDPDGQVRIEGFITDVTEATQAAATQARLAEIVHNTSDFVAIADAEGNTTYVNVAGRDLVGDEGLRDTLLDYTPAKLAGRLRDGALPKAARYGRWQGEMGLLHQDGSEIPVSGVVLAHRDATDATIFYSAVYRDLSAQKDYEAKITRLSFRDPLTDLANRTLLLNCLSQEISRSQRHGGVGSLLLLDLDDFKPVNDSLGHPVGDEMLKALAERLAGEIRTEDTLARIGGDEFVILLPELGADDATAGLAVRRIAERLHGVLDSPVVTAEITLHLSASIGISLFPTEPDESPHEVLRRADAAMYEAKQAGKGTSRFYRPEIQSAIHRRLTMEQELRRGFQAGELSLHYQPLVRLNSEAVCGAEALLRWQHPQRGFISPADFIPVAEQSGFVVPLGDWVLREALQQGKAWLDQQPLPDDFQLSVNISPRQFALPGFVDMVTQAIEDSGFPPRMVTLEITETVLWEDPSVPDKMAELNRFGIRFAVDDFGTGYSSLVHLKRLPVDTLKIDKSFIQDMESSVQSRTITETLLLMAAKLGLGTVAEGIEQADQAERVRAWGCTAAQGFLYGRPVPADEFPRS